ncbi:H(+)-transporting V0 sector ATPase subunit a [Naganishia albida]|nr:H(+)-transporting V0 sector ATPase subunit a [Naganishia albida]
MGYPSLFRSEEMSLVQLYIPTEVAHDTISELGVMGNFQFKDLNGEVNAFQRSFVGEIRRLDEMERRLRLFQNQITSSSPPIGITPLSASAPFTSVGPRAAQAFDDLDVKLAEHEQRMGQINQSWETLGKRQRELEEAKCVLRETAGFFSQADNRHIEIRGSFDDGDGSAPLLENAAEYGSLPGESGFQGVDLDFVAGTIERSRMPVFERILWRILRGNLYMNYSEIEEPFVDPTTNKETYKDVFIIFAHGAELLAKIRKVADSMGGTLYPIDSSADKRNEALREVTSRLEDINSVLFQTGQTRRVELGKIAENLMTWKDAVAKEKAIYQTMNLLSYDAKKKTLAAEGWCPTRDISSIQQALRRATETAGTTVPPILSELRTHQTPPTFHRTNKFTEGFQTIIDSYGIATYQEVNPGLFTCVTFPFLFAVMFGDLGHGVIATLAAITMITFERKLAKAGLGEIFETFFFGRYIILLMGMFSMYTGLIYNDIFAKSLHIWQSGWEWPQGANGTVNAIPTGTTYLFGLDPAWHGADNALVFTNSYKMKMSIILGVIHMTFAICLQVPNHLKFKKYINIWCEFIPQILFMQSIFGYLVICVIYKWSLDWSQQPNSPPGLLNMLIYMFLSPGTVDPATQLYPGQSFVQVFLLLLALVCVPWMLCVKPYILYREHQKIKGQGYQGVGDAPRLSTSQDMADEEDGNGHAVAEEDGDEHPFEMGDVIIHQVIHTIEFCLGCISNTASYLRLWALSLAHAQLSEVLYNMTLEGAFGMTGVMGVAFTVVMFALWFILTLAILCIMEGLSAFLHALRLHWVEANGKHYMAGGYAFAPLSFAHLGEEIEEQ